MSENATTEEVTANTTEGEAQPTTASAEQESGSAFTQADVDRIVVERLKQERKKYADYSDVKQKASEFDKLQESQKTEQQKLADATAAAQEVAKTASSELALMKAAVKHGLSETDLELLGTHGTPEEIDLRAEKLAARLKVAGEAKPKPDFGGGDRGEDVATGKQLTKADVDKLYTEKKYDEIEKARTDGRLSTLLGG